MSMRLTLLSISILLMPFLFIAQSPFGETPLAHTYSIVAFDPETGEMGAAVQSNWFSVGTLVTWGEPGVGVVATQSFVNTSYGPQGLAMMKLGIEPEIVINQLVDGDPGKSYRQVAVLNAEGKAAAHTGKKCIEAAGHIVGKHYSVQANLMDNETVWPAMAEAFEKSDGQPLAERLMLTLEAAQAAGGDIRGKQSAALIVVSGDANKASWEKNVDLRVDDHPEPLVELKRLLKVHRAYEHMNRGDVAVEEGDTDRAMEEYGAAQVMFPDNLEMKYWHAVALVNSGQLEKALPIFKNIFERGDNWRKLTPRLIKNGLLTVEKGDLEKIMSQ